MADIKISALPTSPAITSGNVLPYSTGSATRAVAVNTGNSANTLMLRDGSGNVAANTITANTFTGGTFNGTHTGDGSGLTGITVTGGGTNPAGAIIMFGGATAPSGYLLCDGSRVSRTSFNTLFAVIGTTYGAGDGGTTFNLPDLRGRVPVGAGTGTGLTARSRGQTFGAESSTLSVTNLPPHRHRVLDPSFGGLLCNPGSRRWVIGGQWEGVTLSLYSNPMGGNVSHDGNAQPATANSTPFNNIQPSAVVNYIIKT